MKRLLTLIASSCLFSFLIGTTALAQNTEYTIHPTYTHQGNKNWILHTVEPGDTIRDFLTAKNLSDEPLTLSLNFNEAEPTTKDSGHFKLSNKDIKTHLGTWINLEKKQVVLPPQSEEKIPFSIAIPENANLATFSGAIFAEPQNNTKADEGLTISTRIGVRTYITVTDDPSLTTNTQANTFKKSSINAWVALIALFFLLSLGVFKHFKEKSAALCLLLACSLSFPLAHAQVMEIEIAGGGYVLRGPKTIPFEEIKATFNQEQTSITHIRDLEELNFVEITDLNGGAPFSVNVSATDFISDGKDTITRSHFEIRNHDEKSTDIEAIQTTKEGVALDPSTDEFAPLEETRTLFNRTEGDDPGKWKIFPSLKLKIPPNTNPGIYQSTVIFTII